MRVVEDSLEVLFVADQEAEVVVLLLQPLELRERARHAELLLEATAAVLESVVVEEDYVGVGELPTGLLGDLHVHFPNKRDVEEADLVLGDDGLDGLLGALRDGEVGLLADGLEPDLHTSVDLVELDFIIIDLGVFLDLHEVVVAVQPNQLDRGQTDAELIPLHLLHF